MIAELQRQIAELKVKLAQLQGQTGEWCHTFNSNLGVGASGRGVRELHTALGKEGFPVVIDKDINGASRYSERTAAAVSAFQLKYKNEILTPLGLANPTGYVGPATRAALNRLYGCKPVTGNLPPVISDVSGPTTLKIGETGTWTVQASDPENGPLSYSVVWGDEMAVPVPLSTTPSAGVQQTATFTHAYAQAGTYYPKFKVTDNAGQSNSTSLSVVVSDTSTAGSGTATIKVVDQNDLPLGGVMVSLGRLPLGTIDPYYYSNWPPVGSKQTDSYGLARFTGLEDGIYRISTEKSGYYVLNRSGDGKISPDDRSLDSTTKMFKILSGLDLTVYLEFYSASKNIGYKFCNNGDEATPGPVSLKIQVGSVTKTVPSFSALRGPGCSSASSHIEFWNLSENQHGTYEVRAIIDPANTYQEIDETNNEAKISITI